jgi:hypothetical protein
MSDERIGIKFDNKKSQWSLMPFKEVEDILKVLEFGAIKYSPDNWKYLENAQIRYFEALMRHLLEWKNSFDKGNDNVSDKESGLSSLSHAGCCLLFLMWHCKEMDKKANIKESTNEISCE